LKSFQSFDRVDTAVALPRASIPTTGPNPLPIFAAAANVPRGLLAAA
jgi:hypothetical protein